MQNLEYDIRPSSEEVCRFFTTLNNLVTYLDLNKILGRNDSYYAENKHFYALEQLAKLKLLNSNEWNYSNTKTADNKLLALIDRNYSFENFAFDAKSHQKDLIYYINSDNITKYKTIMRDLTSHSRIRFFWN